MKRTRYIHSLIIMLTVIFLLPIRANAKTALWNHYKSIGAFEGRIAYATNEHRTAQLRAYEIASLITNDGMTEYIFVIYLILM